MMFRLAYGRATGDVPFFFRTRSAVMSRIVDVASWDLAPALPYGRQACPWPQRYIGGVIASCPGLLAKAAVQGALLR